METEQLLDTAIDAFQKIYTEAPLVLIGHWLVSVTALNLTRCAATLASSALRPLSSDETIIAAARAALALAGNAAG